MFRAAIRKEMRLLGRDPGALVALFAMPLAMVAFFGFAYTGSGSGDPCALDPGAAAASAGIGGFDVAVPATSVLFAFFIAVTVGISFVEERQTGTWRRLLATPVSPRLLLVAKLVPWYVVGLVQMALLFGVGALAFGIEVRGSVLGLVALTAAVIYCAVALGLLVASFGGSAKQVGSIVAVVVLVMGMLGGGMVPRVVMPDAMRTMGLFVPHGWAIDAYHDLLSDADTTLAMLTAPIAAILGFGTAFAALGLWRFRYYR